MNTDQVRPDRRREAAQGSVLLQSRTLGIAQRVIGWITKAIGAYAALGFYWLSRVPGLHLFSPVQSGLADGLDLGLILVFLIVSIWIIGVGRNLDVRGRRRLAPVLHSPEQLPDGSYVLYLRSFNDDIAREMIESNSDPLSGVLNLSLSELTQEEQLIASLRVAGPVVALGQPDEQLPRLGALRIYRSNDTWRETVVGLLRRARLVVVSMGSGRNVCWELFQAIRIVVPQRLVLLIIMDPEEYARSREIVGEYFDSEARELRGCDRKWTPPLLPEAPSDLGGSPGWVIQFDGAWTATSLVLPGLDWITFRYSGRSRISNEFRESLSSALRPVFRYLADADGIDVPIGSRHWIMRMPAWCLLVFGPPVTMIVDHLAGAGFAIGSTCGILVCGVVGVLIGYPGL